ncbi:MAG: hypothetical protein J5910_10030 [Lachnospiraceae bacterium]|nr:hypothetical protein [Lachnospiraceae bacterium]
MINNDKNNKNELNKRELNMDELEMVTGGGVIEDIDIFHNNNYADNNGGPIDDFVSGRFYVG